jgi:hypothetical protein
VYSVASAATGNPSSRIVSLVTGLMLTSFTSPDFSRARQGPSSALTSPRAMFELVSVT